MVSIIDNYKMASGHHPASHNDSDLQIIGEDDNDSLIVVEGNDSLILMDNQANVGHQSQTSALDRVQERVNERYRHEAEKLERQRNRRDAEKVHSQFISGNISSSPQERNEAKRAVAGWSRKHSVKVLDKKLGQKVKPRHTSAAASSSSSQAGPAICLDITCPVLNCGALYDEPELYRCHMANGPHLPCNPLKHLRNNRLRHSTANMCPMCGRQYMNEAACHDHMQASGHDIMMGPMAVGGFVCPQCLMLYPEKEMAQAHMNSESHHSYTYQMADDGECAAEPVMMPRVLVESYVDKCRHQPWQVECLECGCHIKASQVTTHIARDHPVMALTQLTASEIFAAYLRAYTCVQCLRLFNKLPPDGLGAVHKCNEDASVLGMIVENDCRTFAEFVRRVALPLIDEEDLLQTPVEGATEMDSPSGTQRDTIDILDSPNVSLNSSDIEILCEAIQRKRNISASSNKENVTCNKTLPADGSTPPVDGSIQAADDSIQPADGSTQTADGRLEVLASTSGASLKRKCQADHKYTGVGSTLKKMRAGSCEDIDVDSYSSESSHDVPKGGKDCSEINLIKPLDSPSDSQTYLNLNKDFVCSVSQSKKPTNVIKSTEREAEHRSASSHSEKDRFREINSAKRKQSATGSNWCSPMEVNWPPGPVSLLPEPSTSGISPIAKVVGNIALNMARMSIPAVFTPPDKPSLLGPGPGSTTPAVFTPPDKPSLLGPGPGFSAFNIPEYGLLPMRPAGTLPGGSRGPDPSANIPHHNAQSLSYNSSSSITSRQGPASFRRYAKKPLPSTSTESRHDSDNRTVSPPGNIQTASAAELVWKDNSNDINHNDEPSNLKEMNHIIFLDLDNWPSFFKRLPSELPEKTLVWGFYGGNREWNEPTRCLPFMHLKNNNGFILHGKCGRTKDAADFALVMQVGRLDERLPKHICFTILSGDHGFVEVERQMKHSKRRAVVINPHHKDHTTVYTLIKSVAET